MGNASKRPDLERQRADNDSVLQELNPLPFASTILNTSGWIVYAVLEGNWYIYCSDVPGLLCGIWMTFSLYPYASAKVLLMPVGA
jgi:hypothetical protein